MYSPQRKAQHKVHGGPIEVCNYCNGGESYDKMAEDGMYSKGGEVMAHPHNYSQGGDIRKRNERGVHEETSEKGVSEIGRYNRGAKEDWEKDAAQKLIRGSIEGTREEARKIQPKLMSEGGEVSDHQTAKNALYDLLDRKSNDLKYMHAPNGMAHGGEASADSEESNIPMVDSKRLSMAIRAKKKRSMELEAKAEQSNAEDAADSLQEARVDSEVGFGHDKTSSEGGDLSDSEYTEMDGPGLKRRMRLKKMLSGLVQGKGR